MRAFIGPQRAVDEAIQLRQYYHKQFRRACTCLIVEGSTDSTLLQAWLARSHCFIVSANGKTNALEALFILENKGFRGVLALVDADYDHLQQTPVQSTNVLRTDTHDAETMIVASPALRKYLAFVLPSDKHKYLDDFVRNMLEKLLEVGKHLGYIRWIMQQRGHVCNYDKVRFTLFVHSQTLGFTSAIMISEVCKYAQPTIDPAVIQSEITYLLGCNHDPFQICRGHDLAEVLVIVLPRLLSRYIPYASALEASERHAKYRVLVEEQLRMCYEYVYFQQTTLYSLLRIWETSNSPYVILDQSLPL